METFVNKKKNQQFSRRIKKNSLQTFYFLFFIIFIFLLKKNFASKFFWSLFFLFSVSSFLTVNICVPPKILKFFVLRVCEAPIHNGLVRPPRSHNTHRIKFRRQNPIHKYNQISVRVLLLETKKSIFVYYIILIVLCQKTESWR